MRSGSIWTCSAIRRISTLPPPRRATSSTRTRPGSMPVAGDDHQPVAFHPADGLADRGAALPETLGDPGAQRGDALLLELVDRAEIHLGGVDELVHAPSPSSTTMLMGYPDTTGALSRT